jgi:hypothetical protein
MTKDTSTAFGSPLRVTNSVGRFLLELSALAALAVWGFNTANGIALQLVLAIAAPIAAATVWGLFVAPRARFPLPTLVRSGVELLVFGSATLAIWAVGAPALAAIFAGLAVLNVALTNHWHQWEAARAALA